MLLLLVESGVLSRGLTLQQAVFWDIALKDIGELVAVAGAAVAAVKYLDEKARNAHVSFMKAQKPSLTKRQEVYCERDSTTSTPSNKALGPPSTRVTEFKFWHLYRGALPLVTDRHVCVATDRFEDIHVDDSLGAEAKSVSPHHANKDLAVRCRSSLCFA